eukprot:499307-Amphidinium_carterae.1
MSEKNLRVQFCSYQWLRQLESSHHQVSSSPPGAVCNEDMPEQIYDEGLITAGGWQGPQGILKLPTSMKVEVRMACKEEQPRGAQ